jgi:uncharacterized protein (DUF433 family)
MRFPRVSLLRLCRGARQGFLPGSLILEDYSFLEREDIQACLDFAAAQSDHALIKVS